MNHDIIRTDSYDFDRRIEKGVVLVFFYDEMDNHCRAFVPIMEEVADTYYEFARVVAIEVVQSPDVAAIFAIETLPTAIVFRDGRMGARIEGINPPHVYENAIEDLL